MGTLKFRQKDIQKLWLVFLIFKKAFTLPMGQMYWSSQPMCAKVLVGLTLPGRLSQGSVPDC